MDRFVSNTINRVDSKGRVSIPAGFRAVLAGQSVLHTILGIKHPVIEAGGPAFVEQNMQRLALMDPFSEEYEMWSFYLMGDSDALRIDAEGRIILTEAMREHAGIADQVAFVGRGHFFQLWEPEKFHTYREAARKKVKELRQQLGVSNSPASQKGSFPPNPDPLARGKGQAT